MKEETRVTLPRQKTCQEKLMTGRNDDKRTMQIDERLKIDSLHVLFSIAQRSERAIAYIQ